MLLAKVGSPGPTTAAMTCHTVVDISRACCIGPSLRARPMGMATMYMRLCVGPIS